MLTERARLAVLFAQREARDARSPVVALEHLLAGLLREDEGMAADLLASHGVRLEAVRRLSGDGAAGAADGALGDDATIDGELPLSEKTQGALDRAELEAKWLERPGAGTEHLLLGLLHESSGEVIRLLLDAGLTEAEVREELVRRTGGGRRSRW